MNFSARDHARRALRRVESDGVFATLAVADELAAGSLSLRDRRLVTELVHGVLRHKSRLDRALLAAATRGLKVTKPMRIILQLAAYQHLFLDRIPPHAIVSDAVDAARSLGGQRMAGFANGLLRKLVAKGEPELPEASSARAYAEIAGSLPRWLVEEIERSVGKDELVAAANALLTVAPLGLRVIGNAEMRDALAAELSTDAGGTRIERSRLVSSALLAQGLGSPAEHQSFADGRFTVQDVAAQLIGYLAAPSASMKILDACAGVGGKTAHLAVLSGGAAITAVDQSEHKLARLRETAQRLNIRSPIECVLDDVADFARKSTAMFDLVVLDAPCSGLGVLRRHPEAKWRVTAEDVVRLARVQAELLHAVAARVAIGGALVYSVCSFTRAEGPDQLEAFVASHPHFEVEAPNEAVGVSQEIPWAELVTHRGAIATWPHRHDADGFYAVRLIRRS